MRTIIQEQITELNEEILQFEARIRQNEAALYRLTPKQTAEELAAAEVANKLLRKTQYDANNGLTIHKLRSAGNIVKITHIRYTTMYTKYDTPLIVPVPSYLRKIYDFNAKGGVTHIAITNPKTGRYLAATSVCHEIDSFIYKRGVQLALETLTQADIAELL